MMLEAETGLMCFEMEDRGTSRHPREAKKCKEMVPPASEASAGLDSFLRQVSSLSGMVLSSMARQKSHTAHGNLAA